MSQNSGQQQHSEQNEHNNPVDQNSDQVDQQHIEEDPNRGQSQRHDPNEGEEEIQGEENGEQDQEKQQQLEQNQEEQVEGDGSGNANEDENENENGEEEDGEQVGEEDEQGENGQEEEEQAANEQIDEQQKQEIQEGENDQMEQQGDPNQDNEGEAQEEGEQQQGQKQQQGEEMDEQKPEVEKDKGQQVMKDGQNLEQQPQQVMINQSQNPIANEEQQKNNEKQIDNNKPQINQQPAQSIENPSNLVKRGRLQQYMNKLEAKLTNLEHQRSIETNYCEKIINEKKALKEKNKQLVQSESKINQKLRQVERQCKKKELELENKQKRIEKLSQELSLYHEMGDIGNLQKMVSELETLVANQKQELHLLHKENQEIKNQSLEGSANIDRKYLQHMQMLEQYKQTSADRIDFLQNQLNQKERQCSQNQEDMSSMDERIKEQMQQISALKEMLDQQKYVSANLQATYQQKINKMEQQMFNGGSERDSIEDMIREKEILLREYSRMELDMSGLNEKYENLKQRFQELQVELKKKDKDKVSRKDYNDILKKFMKCKSCLQRAIKQNKQLRARGFDGDGTGVLLRPEGKILDQEQNQLQRYLQIFNGHVKNSIEYAKETNQMSGNSAVINLKQELKRLQKQLALSSAKAQRMENLSEMLEGQLSYKNNLLQTLMETHRQVKQQYYTLKEESLNTQQELSENIFAKGSLQRLEGSSAKLLIKNRKITEQAEKWKQLYYGIKQKYEQMSGKVANIQSAMDEEPQINQNVAEEAPIVRPAVEKQTQESSTQTEGINTLYYKQLKETLSLLKKFPDKTKAMLESIKKLQDELGEVKKKYEETLQRYNKRFLEVKTMENENTKWRVTAKQEITKEFQDIREIIDNQKLITILRKAKYLIQELQQGNEEEGEVQEEGEGKNENEI